MTVGMVGNSLECKWETTTSGNWAEWPELHESKELKELKEKCENMFKGTGGAKGMNKGH